jgi:hypothetical protein
LLFPFSGAPRGHLSQDLRVVYEQYAIYYLPRPDEIIIVRVLHGSRDIASIAMKVDLQPESQAVPLGQERKGTTYAGGK